MAAIEKLNTKTLKTWANSQKEEDAMVEGHSQLWRTMIGHVQEKNLQGRTVLDFGCNQGGFLRMLYSLNPFARGVGVDIALQSVARANEYNPGLPVQYESAEWLADKQSLFDLAFSHEVIYLLPDLADHARQIARALKPGGVYYAATGCHTDNPLWPEWHKIISEYSNISVPHYSLNDYVRAFAESGFSVSLRPFAPQEFINYGGEDDKYYPTPADKLTYYYRDKILFRFQKAG